MMGSQYYARIAGYALAILVAIAGYAGNVLAAEPPINLTKFAADADRQRTELLRHEERVILPWINEGIRELRRAKFTLAGQLSPGGVIDDRANSTLAPNDRCRWLFLTGSDRERIEMASRDARDAWLNALIIKRTASQARIRETRARQRRLIPFHDWPAEPGQLGRFRALVEPLEIEHSAIRGRVELVKDAAWISVRLENLNFDWPEGEQLPLDECKDLYLYLGERAGWQTFRRLDDRQADAAFRYLNGDGLLP